MNLAAAATNMQHIAVAMAVNGLPIMQRTTQHAITIPVIIRGLSNLAVLATQIA